MYAWNNPFLRMLAAIDEPGASGGQDNVAEVQQNRSGNVKLPDYWPHSPGIWFARVELRFEVCGIVSEREKFAHTVNALTQEATRLVTDLILTPPVDRPYTILKDRLLLLHQLTAVQRAMKIMAMPALGDRRPSQLLADMLEFCPAEEERSAFFRAAFVQRLPAELQVLLDGVEDADLKDLAAKVDKLWIIRGPAALHMAAVDTDSIDSGEAVAALRPNFKKKSGDSKEQGQRGQRSQQGQQGQRGPKMYSLCYKHWKFGADAYHCEDPATCKWTGN